MSDYDDFDDDEQMLIEALATPEFVRWLKETGMLPDYNRYIGSYPGREIVSGVPSRGLMQQIQPSFPCYAAERRDNWRRSVGLLPPEMPR